MTVVGAGKGEHGTLVIVGSGPVGMVSALLLRDRFQRIVLLERQSRERFLNASGFTFPIVFSPAAIAVLQRVGAWEAISQQRSPYFGVVVHKRVLGRDLTWTARNPGVYSHWRNHIVASLHACVVEAGIEVRFDARLDDIDFAADRLTEATLGDIGFDMLLGADGIKSQTRSLLAEAHAGFADSAFSRTLLDRWHAYRLPAVGPVADRFGGGARGIGSHVFVDNLRSHPNDRFRIVTTAMAHPDHEISVVVKYGADVSLDRARELNEAFFAPLVDARTLAREWRNGVTGDYEHVSIPTYALGASLLVGDAAHGFESTGDLINLGIASVGALPSILDDHATIPDALAAYDRSIGTCLRDYSSYALRRSREKITFEVAAFEVGAVLRLNGHHPSMWGIYEDDFEVCTYMRRYRRDRRRVRLGTAILSTGGAVLAGVSGAGRRRRRRDGRLAGDLVARSTTPPGAVPGSKRR